MCLCKECADRVGKATDKCPICRKGIQGLVMVKQEWLKDEWFLDFYLIVI